MPTSPECSLRVIAPRHVASLPFFAKKKPVLGWTLVFISGAVLGSFLAASTGGELRGSYLPDLWSARFGVGSHELRTAAAVLGGMLMAFGARIDGWMHEWSRYQRHDAARREFLDFRRVLLYRRRVGDDTLVSTLRRGRH